MALRTIPYKQELFWFSWMQIPLYFFGTPHSFLALVYYHQWWQFISGDKYLSWTEWKNERNHFHFHFWRDTKMAEEYHQHPLWFTWLYYIPDGTASATIMVQNRDSWRCHYWAFMLILFTIKVNVPVLQHSGKNEMIQRLSCLLNFHCLHKMSIFFSTRID